MQQGCQTSSNQQAMNEDDEQDDGLPDFTLDDLEWYETYE